MSRLLQSLKKERIRLTPARAMLLDVMEDLTSFGEFDSVFAAEKIVYFLQRLGAADIFKVKFSRYYYGPYSGGVIAHLLYALQWELYKRNDGYAGEAISANMVDRRWNRGGKAISCRK